DGIRGFHVTGVQTCALPICKVAIFSLAVAVTMLSAGCSQGLLGSGGDSGSAAEQGPIVLGMLIPQSGSEAAVGPYMQNAAQMARSAGRRGGDGATRGV